VICTPPPVTFVTFVTLFIFVPRQHR
jgi:hypothetical protein